MTRDLAHSVKSWMPPRVRRAVRGPVAHVRRQIAILQRDIENVVRYGPSAPRFAERIWIDPCACEDAVEGFRRDQSGKVIGGDWDLDRFSIQTVDKVRFCLMRWEEGIPWKDTGAYEYLLSIIEERAGPADGCVTFDDVVARYERLDVLFEQVRREGRLRSVSELPGHSFREEGGVYVHVGRHGQPLFGLGGNHRFIISRLLGLSLIPAQIGVVHPAALSRWRETLSPPFEVGQRRYLLDSKSPSA